MVTGARVAQQIAQDVLGDVDFTEPALLLRSTEGTRNQYKEWQPGAPVVREMAVVQTPMTNRDRTGQERIVLPEGVQDEDARSIWLQGGIASLHYGLSDGDRLDIRRVRAVTKRLQRFNGRRSGAANATSTASPIRLGSWRTRTTRRTLSGCVSQGRKPSTSGMTR